MRSSSLHSCPLIDAHAHADLFSPDDWPAVAERAFERGVDGLLNACVWWDRFESLKENFSQWIVPRLATARELKERLLSENKFLILPCLGLHPMEVATRWRTPAGGFDRHKAHADVVLFKAAFERFSEWIWAVGETGFDTAQDVRVGWNSRDELLAAQQFAFDAHVQLSHSFGLPLIIHSRAAWQPTMNAVRGAVSSVSLDSKKTPALRFMIHCYGGPPSDLSLIQRLGGFASFGGVATWPAAKRVRQALVECPSSALLFETDSPDLPPQLGDGLRPQKNEPVYLYEVIHTASQLRGSSVEDLVNHHYVNFCHFLFQDH